MRKELLTAAFCSVLLIGGVVLMPIGNAYPKADFTWSFSPGQTFRVHGKPGTTYEILTHGMAEIVSRDGDTIDFLLPKRGDVYIRAHQPGEKDLLFHLKVGVEEGRTVYSRKIEDKTQQNASANGVSSKEEERISKYFAEEVLKLVNQERRKRGIAPLRLSKELMDAAAIRAVEITQVFSHTRPNGKLCSSLIKQGKYTVGENIAGGSSTPEEVVDRWMKSQGHRANILNSDFGELGVGHVYKKSSPYGHYWVQLFKRPMPRRYRY